MKVAASDYDGTLFRQRTIAQADVDGITAWRKAGHKFGVVSGRDYGMLIPQLKHYGVTYDYAVCNNGGIICKADGTVMWQGSIPLRVLAEMVQEPGVRRSFHFAFSAADTTYLYHDREGSWIAREAKEWDFNIHRIKESDILSLPQIHQLSLGYPQPDEVVEVAAILNEKYGEYVHAYPNGCSLDVTPANVSKDQGIRKLLEVMHWEGAEIFAIGDETNDLPMLKAFNGFTVDTARDVIKAQSRKSYAGVGAMLLDNI